MYPALHSTIRDVLESDDATKVQFIMEPLAFQTVAASAKMHGNRFIDQLAYITRTFAFYMHREYMRITNFGLSDPPTIPRLLTNSTNPALFSVCCYDSTPASMCTTSTVSCSVQPQNHYNAQYGQFNVVFSKPSVIGPSMVGLVTSSAATSPDVSNFNECINITKPNPEVMCNARLKGVSAVIPVQKEVCDTSTQYQYQYQDCPVGFRGRLESHDHTILVLSSMHGTQ